jgi:outer membrane protein
MMDNGPMRLLSIILLASFSFEALTQVSRNFDKKKKPLYELGGGLISLNIPNYPGAASNTPRVIPFPYLIYRGDFLRADEEGTRARFIKSDVFELGMSGGFNFPIDSNVNTSRTGMPNTDTLFGFGPGIIIRLLKNDPLNKLTLGLGLRLNISVGTYMSMTEQGWLVEPNIRYWRRLTKSSPFSFFAGLSMSYADEKYNRFFYQVDEEFGTSERKAYNAKSGVVDIAGSFGGSYDFSSKGSIFIGAFQSNLTTAANKNSPLVEQQVNTGLIAGFAWLFYESSQLVE